jgi:hypothetical protein
VGNEYGRVEFLGLTDVSGVDLGEVVRIGDHCIAVYPEGVDKPEIGKKLNRPAVLHIYQVTPLPGMS